jgi:hypothetical protein
MNDTAFRCIGLTTGLLLLAGLWWSVRAFHSKLPVLALGLLALNPSLIRWGDSLRGYGLGIALIIPTGALIWRYVEIPTRRRFFAAAAFSVFSVQVLYQNSVLILALCAGGIVASLVERKREKAFRVFAIGLIAALSLLPYASTIQHVGTWNSPVQGTDYTIGWFWFKLYQTLIPAGTGAFVSWLALLLLALIAGAMAVSAPRRAGLSATEHSKILFALVVMLVAWSGTFAFYERLSYATEPWYYLTLLAVTAIMIDVILGVLAVIPAIGALRLVAGLSLLLMTITPARNALDSRLTNSDAIAKVLKRQASPNDLIIVTPWYYGVGFSRYYRDSGAWTTLPAITDHRYHRYDLVAAAVQNASPQQAIAPVMRQVEQVLRSGHRVYVTGELFLPWPVSEASTFSLSHVRGEPRSGTDLDIYWTHMLGSYLRRHTLSIETLSTGNGDVVSTYENMRLLVAHGWRQ